MFDSGNVPLAAVAGVPAIGAGFSCVTRFLMQDRMWNVCAFGIDLLVAAVVAIPALLVGRNAALTQIRSPHASSAVNPNWNPPGLLVLMVIFLFCIGVGSEARWSKKAREQDGWAVPLFKGVFPAAVCGFIAIGADLFLGTS